MPLLDQIWIIDPVKAHSNWSPGPTECNFQRLNKDCFSFSLISVLQVIFSESWDLMVISLYLWSYIHICHRYWMINNMLLAFWMETKRGGGGKLFTKEMVSKFIMVVILGSPLNSSSWKEFQVEHPCHVQFSDCLRMQIY